MQFRLRVSIHIFILFIILLKFVLLIFLYFFCFYIYFFICLLSNGARVYEICKRIIHFIDWNFWPYRADVWLAGPGKPIIEIVYNIIEIIWIEVNSLVRWCRTYACHVYVDHVRQQQHLSNYKCVVPN